MKYDVCLHSTLRTNFCAIIYRTFLQPMEICFMSEQESPILSLQSLFFTEQMSDNIRNVLMFSALRKNGIVVNKFLYVFDGVNNGR